MKRLIDHVRPFPHARVVAFYSFGDTLYGGPYYDTRTSTTQASPSACWPSICVARPCPRSTGAPLRLRVENQLGYKMVKWIERIEFVESEKLLGRGGDANEDTEYFNLLPNIGWQPQNNLSYLEHPGCIPRTMPPTSPGFWNGCG